jgi:hypothetical protein
MIKAVGQINHNLLAWTRNYLDGKSSQDGQTSVTSSTVYLKFH